MRHDHLEFTPPPGFTREEATAVYVGPKEAGLDDPRIALRDQARSGRPDVAVRPNLVVRRFEAPRGADLGALATELVAKSLHNLGTDLREIESEVVPFDDGATGVLTTFRFPARKFLLEQTHCFRIDEGVVTQLTLTLDPHQKGHLSRDEVVHVMTRTRVGALQGEEP